MTPSRALTVSFTPYKMAIHRCIDKSRTWQYLVHDKSRNIKQHLVHEKSRTWQYLVHDNGLQPRSQDLARCQARSGSPSVPIRQSARSRVMRRHQRQQRHGNVVQTSLEKTKTSWPRWVFQDLVCVILYYSLHQTCCAWNIPLLRHSQTV